MIVRRGAGLLAIAFLLVPYAIDVVRYGDLTPVDLAQEENTKDLKEIDPPAKKASSRAAFDHAGLTEAEHVLLWSANSRCCSSHGVSILRQFPSEFLLTSRPPPIL